MMMSERIGEVNGGGIEWMEDETTKGVTMKMKLKRKLKSNRKEFLGWGSKKVIEFLQSIDINTKGVENELSQHDVTDIINKYINDHKLVNPCKGKKKRIICDEKLHALFGRKSINRIKIYDLLEPHFAENQEEDDFSSNEDDDDDDGVFFDWNDEESVVKKSKKLRNLVSETTRKSSFAALIPENIKLIYLRKCVVEALYKDEDLQFFTCKVVGSFVRIKTDPNDYLRTNSHILLQVTGVKKSSGADSTHSDILLQVSNSVKDVRICMLSDDYFSEEELEDMRRRIKDGSLPRPTVGELEKKAQVLHQDITKHWIVRELSLLKNLIDRANEKGWRRELFDYLERRHLLQTPSEQSRLLLEVPKVIAEVIEPEVAAPKETDSPKSMLREISVSPVRSLPTQEISWTAISVRADVAEVAVPEENDSPKSLLKEISQSPVCSLPMQDISWSEISVKTDVAVQEKCQPREINKKGVEEVQPNGDTGFAQRVEKQVVKSEVIELSDDEEEIINNGLIDEDPEISQWHYTDPQGDVQGPFPLTSLKCWSDAAYFPAGFQVWKTGLRETDAVLLSDVLRLSGLS